MKSVLLGACLNKQAYRDPRLAEERRLHRQQVTGQSLYIYRCNICGAYHMTHKAGKKRRR